MAGTCREVGGRALNLSLFQAQRGHMSIILIVMDSLLAISTKVECTCIRNGIRKAFEP